MNEEAFRLLVNLFVGPFFAAGIASLITYWLSHRRFIREHRWERKADAYAKIIDSLITMTYALERWVKYEVADYHTEAELPEKAKNDYQVARAEYDTARTQIERAATGGDYIISRKAAEALSDLIKELRRPTDSLFNWSDWFAQLNAYYAASRDCLKTVRAEAESDLRVK